MTKTEIIAKFKKDYPTLHIGNDEDGYCDMTDEEYNATISKWADNELEVQAELKASEDKENARLALLAKLGITAEEAALLLK